MHVRTNHPVTMYIAGKSAPELPNDRLVILRWKGNEKTGRVAHSSRCFSIPVWQPELVGNDKDYLDILIDAIEQRQMLAAHKYVSEMLEINAGVCNDIPNSVVSPAAILAAFIQESEETDGRGKISGAQIAAWFNEKLGALIIEAFADKQGMLAESYTMTEADTKKLEQTSNGYRATLEKLASPQPRVTIDTAKALKKALDLLPNADTDMVARKLNRKLDGILNAKDEEIGLAVL